MYKVIVYNYYNNQIAEYRHETKETAIQRAKRIRKANQEKNQKWNGWIGVEDERYQVLYWCDINEECENCNEPF